MRRLHDIPSMVTDGPVRPNRSQNHVDLLAVVRREETVRPESNATRTKARAPKHAPGSEPAVYPRDPLVRGWKPRPGSLPSKVKFAEGYRDPRSPHKKRPKAHHLGNLASLAVGKACGVSKQKNPNALGVVLEERPFIARAEIGRSTVLSHKPQVPSPLPKESSVVRPAVVISLAKGPTLPAWSTPTAILGNSKEFSEIIRYPRPPGKKRRRRKLWKKEKV